MSEPFEFRCEDLSQDGVVLIPPSSPQFDALLDDICKRSLDTDARYPGALHGQTADIILPGHRATAAILLNQSGKAIAMAQAVWRVQLIDGRSYIESLTTIGQRSLLLPFGLRPDVQAVFNYGTVVMPCSKRYLGRGHLNVGDNSDIRPPHPHEIWKGGYVTGSGSGLQELSGPIRSIALSLDGVYLPTGSS